MEDTVDQLRAELAEMRVVIERQQSSIAKLQAGAPSTPDGPRRTRRQMLKLAGATLAGAAAGAACIAGSAVPAVAYTGDYLVVGLSGNDPIPNVAETATELNYDG